MVQPIHYKEAQGFKYWDNSDYERIMMYQDALKQQVGGDHYKKLKIQPVEYIQANKLGFIEGSVIKYVTRHKQKNGADDIKKAIHFLELLLKLEYDNVDVTGDKPF